MRIQKYLSEQGIASRRESERLLLAGKIKINGKVIRELGTQIDPLTDIVKVLSDKENAKLTVALYKPRDIVSSRNSKEGKTIFELLPQFSHLHILGRLDKSSEGLLLLSNDGVLAKKITGEEHIIEKEYEVTVREKVRPFMLEQFRRGITLEDGKTLPAKAELISSNVFRIVLREGRNHQIRRMCDVFRLTVTKLVRTRVGFLRLQGLAPGRFREVAREDIFRTESKKGR